MKDTEETKTLTKAEYVRLYTGSEAAFKARSHLREGGDPHLLLEYLEKALARPDMFSPRGIGFDRTPGCFVCGGPDGGYSNIAAFVDSKEAGEAIVALFQYGARLDFRPSEPSWVQVKVGACTLHQPNLERLMEATYESKRIDAQIIGRAVHGEFYGMTLTEAMSKAQERPNV